MKVKYIQVKRVYAYEVSPDNRPTKFQKAAPSGCEDNLILVVGCRAKYY